VLPAATADRPKSISDSFQGEGEVFVDQIADEGGEEEDESWVPWPDSSGGFSE
jgi:hypothetical protein